LIIGRAFQGVGAALIAPAAMALVMTLFTTPSELGKAMSIWGAAAPAGGTAGVFLGGVITQWIGWRWTFLINVPVAVVVLASVPALLPRGVSRRGRIDLAGAAAATLGLTTLVYATVTANDAGWSSSRTVVLYGIAVAALGTFVVIEARRREPLVRLGIFRTSNLAASNVVMALLGAAWIPMWFFLNLYLQSIRGYDAFDAGLALLPMTVSIMLVMVGVTGRLVAKFGFKTPMIAGLALLATGIGLFARLPADGSFVVDVLPASLVAALGMSLAYIPVLISALSSARPDEAGLASGVVNTTYQVGSALGLAAMTAISTSTASASTLATVGGVHAAFAGAAVVAGVAATVAIKAVRATTGAVEEAEVSALLDAA
jgi:EmrB/QacA subfamily drug resistance transporter